MNTKQTILIALTMVCLSVIGYSSYMLWDIYSNRANQRTLHNHLLAYSPTRQLEHHQQPTNNNQSKTTQTLHQASFVNQSIVTLQARHPSVVGWLSIPNTWIDHPFVQSDNNDFYLHRDITHNRAHAGTVFMDYRNSYNISDFNTLIYGHNMNNGSMFAPIAEFECPDFFMENRIGYLFLPYQTYEIEFIAFATIRPYDPIIYNPTISSLPEQLEFLEHVQQVATNYHPVDLSTHPRLITLSTCRNDSANSRLVLIGVLGPGLGW